MSIITTALQTLNGIQGGVNGNMAVQVLGSVAIDFGSSNTVQVYNPIINSGANVIPTEAYVRMPNGAPAPTSNGYPLQVSIRLGGVQIIIVTLNPTGLDQSQPIYNYGNLQGSPPLNAGNGISAAMIVPSSASKMGFVDVIGYGASAS